MGGGLANHPPSHILGAGHDCGGQRMVEAVKMNIGLIFGWGRWACVIMVVSYHQVCRLEVVYMFPVILNKTRTFVENG